MVVLLFEISYEVDKVSVVSSEECMLSVYEEGSIAKKYLPPIHGYCGLSV